MAPRSSLDLSFHARAWKPIEWRGSALDDLRRFREDARREAGFQLGLMQQGLMADDWKPMPAVGAGAIEIRLHVGAEHRVLIVTKFAEALYVLHAFEKKSQKTSRRDISLTRKRYRELIAERRQP